MLTPKHYSYMWMSDISSQRNYDVAVKASDLTDNILEPGCRDLLHFSQKSISEVGHRCWAIRLESQYSTSTQSCWMGVRSGISASRSSSLTPNWEKPLLCWLCVRRHCYVEITQDLLQTVATKSEARYCLKYHLCVVSIAGTKGAR